MNEIATATPPLPAVDYAEMTRIMIEEIRAHGRPVTGWAAGQQVLVLTTIGAKSGVPRSVPLKYSRDGDAWIVTASKSGAPTHPAWYHNLRKDPTATIELERESIRVRATTATGAERMRLWDQHVELHTGIAEYPSRTERVIPVVILERTETS